DHLTRESRNLRAIAGLLKTSVEDAPTRLATLLEERRKLERDLAEARKKLALGGGGGDGAGDAVREIAGVKFLGRSVTGVEMKDLKSLADDAKRKVGSGIVAIVGVSEDGKAGIVVGVTKDLTERFDAVTLVRAGSAALGGKGGGGRPDMAQAGGPDGAKADAAIEAVASALES
ncbi:MAG: DHHA1 domain-containing protein, partial [Salinarimonas sp.]